MVLLLLSRGANVLIVNNKGQTPRSLAVSHLKEETTREVARVEAEQLEAGGAWSNFRESHSDGVAYGDLDVRFLDADNLRGRGGWDIIGSHTNDGSLGKTERLCRSSLGGPQDPATGSSRRWENAWDALRKQRNFSVSTAGYRGRCVRPTKRYVSRRPFKTGKSQNTKRGLSTLYIRKVFCQAGRHHPQQLMEVSSNPLKQGWRGGWLWLSAFSYVAVGSPLARK